MHVAAETNAAQGSQLGRVVPTQRCNRGLTGGDPVLRILFAPSGTWVRDPISCIRHANDIATLIGQQRAQPRRSHVKTKKHKMSSQSPDAHVSHDRAHIYFG